METVGWAAAAVAAIGGVALVVGYVLDQVPVLSKKAEKAIVAVRCVRAAWRGDEAPKRGQRKKEARPRQ